MKYFKKYQRLGVVLLIVAALGIFYENAHLQESYAKEVVRFHVLANSDSEEDQRVKYLVRDEVLAWLEEAMDTDANGNTANSREYTLTFLESHLTDLEQVADQVLEREGASYQSEAAVESCWFPERTYGACTFPAGFYKALRLKLGEAEGKNWWCVLYPRLCFQDCVHAVVEEDQMEQLEEVLTAEEYEMLLEEPSGWKIAFRWF